jgi:fumarylacetoacetate (FAA) hydrolase
MKLATYRDGSRDGQLLVVSRDLSCAHHAFGIASRLQDVLDDWNFLSPQLEELSQTLNHGKARHAFAFDPRRCLAPLPRAYQRVGTCGGGPSEARSGGASGAPSGGAPGGPRDAARAAALAAPPARGAPRLYQDSGDNLSGPHDPVVCADPSWGVHFHAEVVALTADVPPASGPDAALERVRLLALTNRLTLRHWWEAERAEGLGFVRSHPATAFSPVAVTPDELGGAWHGGRVHLGLVGGWNGRRLAPGDTGGGAAAPFGELIAQLCALRALGAGSIVGGGVLGELTPQDPPARDGDLVRWDLCDANGASVFGAIEQRLVWPS